MNGKALARATDYIKDWLRFQYERGDTPGFVIAIAHKGKIVFNEAYGYANLEKKQKLTPQHLFRIASHSKTFTATAIFQLQEKGKLRLDDRVVKHLPWLNDHTDKRLGRITVRQLMSHGAGVIRDGTSNGFWELEEPFPSEEEFKKDILASDLIIDYNTKLKYSNYGYTLLGMVIESVSGRPYNDYVTQNIVKPLGLINTGPEFSKKIEDKLVTGYTRPDFNKKPLPIANIDTKIMSPATGFYSNSEDLCKYFTAHMVGSGKLLSDESKKDMQHKQWEAENSKEKEEYCLGFEAIYTNNHRLLGHGGGFPGHITMSVFDPQGELVVIVLTNANGSWSQYMATSVVKVLDYFHENSQPPRWQKLQGRYMNLWSINDVVAIGDKLVLAHAFGWEPFSNPEELVHQKDYIFKIINANSFSSVDEPVEFKLNSSGKVTEINYAGGRLLPEKSYLAGMSKKKIVG